MPSQMIGKLILNNEFLARDLATIASFPTLIEEYKEFGTGTWKNHSLWNNDGDFKNTQYQDFATPALVTELGKQLPYINQLIFDHFDTSYLKMVRARNLINGFVVPHKDFVELERAKNHYLRVFIPLENNVDAYHSDEESVFQMQKGEIWRLDASIVHAAANFGHDSRVHLCLDFQLPEASSPFASIYLDQKLADTKVAPTFPQRESYAGLEEKLNYLAKNIKKDTVLDTLVELSKIHFQFDVSIKDCYDWLLAVAEKSGSFAIVNKCKQLKTYMTENRVFGERFSYQDN